MNRHLKKKAKRLRPIFWLFALVTPLAQILLTQFYDWTKLGNFFLFCKICEIQWCKPLLTHLTCYLVMISWLCVDGKIVQL